MPGGCLCVLNQTVCIMNNFYSIRISAQIAPTQWALAQMGLEIDAILQAPPAGSGRSAAGFPKGHFLEGHRVKIPALSYWEKNPRPGSALLARVIKKSPNQIPKPIPHPQIIIKPLHPNSTQNPQTLSPCFPWVVPIIWLI